MISLLRVGILGEGVYTKAVDTFGLRGADDDVLEGATGLHVEHGIGRTTFAAFAARW